MYRTKYLIFSLAIVSALAVVASFPLAVTQQEDERRGLTGAHSVLTCDNCHSDEVWHTTSKDITICQTCHASLWETVEENKHGELFFEGEKDVLSGTVVVRYCATCHNPHQPDVLRIQYSDGETIFIEFENYPDLCVKCHDF
jgi:hypothetical protein